MVKSENLTRNRAIFTINRWGEFYPIKTNKEETIMATVNISRLMKNFLAVGILVMAAVCGILFAFGTAIAEESTPSEAAIAEMKKMLGGVPAELQLYPESARAAGWEMMKAADFNKNTALPSKVRELIGLAVSAQIPCQYCVYYLLLKNSVGFL